MVTLSDTVFLISLLACIGLSGYRFYNILNGFKAYGLKDGFLIYSAYLVSFAFNFLTAMYMVSTDTYYGILFGFNALFFMLNTVFFIAEVINNLGEVGRQEARFDGSR